MKPYRSQGLRTLLISLLLWGSSLLQAQDVMEHYKEVNRFEVGVIHDVALYGSNMILASDIGLWVTQLPLTQNAPVLLPSDAPVMRIFALSYTPWLVSINSENTLVLWDLRTFTPHTLLDTPKEAMTSFACCLSNGIDLVFATGSADNTVRLWSVTDASEIQALTESAPVTSIALLNATASSPALIALGGGDGSIHFLSETGDDMGGLESTGQPATSLAFIDPSRDDTMMLAVGSADGTIQTWTSPMSATFEYQGANLPLYDVPLETGITSLALFKKGRATSEFIDPANPDAGIIEWEGTWRALKPTSSTWQKTLTLIGHADSVSTLRFAQQRELLISTGTDNTMRIWDLTTGEQLSSVFTLADVKTPFPIAELPLFYADATGVIRMEDPATDDDEMQLRLPRGTKFYHIGAVVVSVITDDGVLTYWELQWQ